MIITETMLRHAATRNLRRLARYVGVPLPKCRGGVERLRLIGALMGRVG